VLLAVALIGGGQVALAADVTPAQVDAVARARAAGLAAQKAAVMALKAAEDAIAATDSAARQDAVQRALQAAAAANEAATAAQLAAASVQGSFAQAPAVPATPAATEVPAPADAAKPVVSIADAQVSGIIKAGQADGTASITLSWSDQTLQRNIVNSVTFSAPTSDSADRTRLGTLDGLADSASIKYAQARYFPVDPGHPDEEFWAVGWSAKVGKKEFSYIDPLAFKEAKSSKTPVSAALFAGYVPTNTLMVLAKAEYQKKFKDSDAKVLCRTTTTAEIECLSGAAGQPVRKTANIYTVGARYLGSGFTLAPTFNYDRNAKVRGIDFPVYFLGDGTAGVLSGGIGASWRSDTRDTALYVFVGSPFSFWSPQ
jgi:hypothetical protein